jgi:hypothetical protein
MKTQTLTISDCGRGDQCCLAVETSSGIKYHDYTTADVDLRSNRLRKQWWERNGYNGRLEIVDQDIEARYTINV